MMFADFDAPGHRFYAEADPGDHAPGNATVSCLKICGNATKLQLLSPCIYNLYLYDPAGMPRFPWVPWLG